MPANIAKIDGQDAVMVARDAAWHHLGVVTEDAQTWDDTTRIAKLDWDAEKVQLRMFYPVGGSQGSQLEASHSPVDAWGVVRKTDGQFLGSVGSDYTVVQYREAGKFIDALLEAEDGGAHYESAGALGKGERMWALARIPGADFNVAGDEHKTYLMFATSHDGSMSNICKLTTVRVVCQNALTAALNDGASMLKVKHTQNVQVRLDAAAKVMQGVKQTAKSLEAKLNALAVRKLDKPKVETILTRIFPKPPVKTGTKEVATRRDNMLAEILASYEINDHDANPAIRGTAFNLLNAITEYTDHLRGTRITDNRKAIGYTVNKARAENALFGSGEALKNKALEVILQSTGGVPANSSLLDAVVAGM